MMTGLCVCTDGLMCVHKCPGVEYVGMHMYIRMYPGVYIRKHACCVNLHVCMDLCTSYHSFTR